MLVAPLSAQAGSITLYKGEAFGGESMTLRDDVRNFADYPSWNDAAMSAIVHSGLWEACIDAYYQRCMVLEGSDMRDFHRIGLDYKISSIHEVNFRRYRQEQGYRDRFYDDRYHDGPRFIDFVDNGTYIDNPYDGPFAYGYRNPAYRSPEQQRRIIDLSEVTPRPSRPFPDNRKEIIWNNRTDRRGNAPPSSFLSPCQQTVHDGILERYGNVEPIWFNGSSGDGDNGRVTAAGGLAFRYRCRGDVVNVW